MEKTVRAYVVGSINEIQVKSLREVKEYFRVFKGMADQREAELRHTGSISLGGAGSNVDPRGSIAPLSSNRNLPGVGTVDKTAGFSVGVAAPSKQLTDVLKASPPRQSHAGYASDQMSTTTAERDGAPAERTIAAVTTLGGQEAPDKNTAFADYKRTAGAKLARAIKESSDELLAKKKRISDIGFGINILKTQIDELTAQLEQKRIDRHNRGEEDVVDTEEFELVRQLKAVKQEYRCLYDELTVLKSEREQLAKTVDVHRKHLMDEFEHWYNNAYNVTGASPSKPARPLLQMDDDLDEGERFELLERNRVIDEDPESVAYYTARKAAQSKQPKRQNNMFQRTAQRK
jgi:kinesin family protein 6/9